MELANVARKEGILALEGREIGHPFLERGINLCIDGHAPEVVQKMLSKDINLTIDRHNDGITMFKAIGDAAPAMGMIGTLIGLVQMLAMLDDPTTIGPSMAIALLTTFYGAFLSTVVFAPLATKIEHNAQGDAMQKRLVLAT